MTTTETIDRRGLLCRLGLTAAGGLVLLADGGRAFAATTPKARTATLPPTTDPLELSYFGRMFPNLQPFTPDPDPDTADADLTALANAMLEPGGGFDTTQGAVFTYLAQFLDHDITLDLQPQPTQDFSFDSRGRLLDPTGAVVYDYETARFDLSSLYGGGPSVSPQLYQADGVHFLEGANVNGVQDIPRNPDGTGVLVEKRNDENQITSQLHLAYLKFHNALADLYGYGFQRTRELVILHHHWIILHQFMPVLFGQNVVDGLMNGSIPRLYRPGNPLAPVMPVEFSAAAYRFGHSMIRNAYSINPVISPNNKNARNTLFAGVGGAPGAEGGTGTPLTPVGDLHGGYPLTADHVIDWGNFANGLYNPATPGQSLQVFKQIGADGLHMIGQSMFGQPPNAPLNGTGAGLPIGGTAGAAPSGSNSIAYRDLVRGGHYLLPSGQDVAAAMGVPVIPPATAIDPSVAPGFESGTPLWFYILYETFAQNQNSPTVDDFDNTGTAGDFTQVALGPVGARICADVFLRLLELDLVSLFGSRWVPVPPVAPARGQFAIEDLLVFAGVAQRP